MKRRRPETPKQIIHAYCQHCLGLSHFKTDEVRDCQGDKAYSGSCPFFPYRLGKRPSVRVFRVFCLQCMGDSVGLVRECETSNCIIHYYRFGKNPTRIGKGRGPEVMSRARAQKLTLSKGISIQNKLKQEAQGQAKG